MENESERRMILDCAVAGVHYHLAADDPLWDELTPGTPVALVRDRHNSHDANAVAVALAEDFGGDAEDFDFRNILGYIPRDCNAQMAALLDLGWHDMLSAELTEVNPEARGADRLHLAVYLRGRERRAPRYDGLRVQSVDRAEMRDLGRRLSERGMALFRWQGRSLPRAGTQVAVVCDTDAGPTACMMRVLAAGAEDCRRYIPLPEGGEGTPFVLANIAGPAPVAALGRGARYSVQEQPDPAVADALTFFFKNLF